MDIEAFVVDNGIDTEHIPDLFSKLAVGAYVKYMQTRNKNDINEAISWAEKGINLAHDSNPLYTQWLSNIGLFLSSRYERTGEVKDLEEAIKTARRVVESTPDDHPDLTGRLNNLGLFLGSRYKRIGEIRDLEEAIYTIRQAGKSTPDGFLVRAQWLNNLAIMLRFRYERTGDMRNLEEAIQASQQAVQSTPANHPDRAKWSNNLGIALGRQYKRTGDLRDLEEAIQTIRKAVKSMPDDHPDQAICSANLGNMLSLRYERTEDIRDLEEAIQASRQAVQFTPDDHPDRAKWLNSLGISLDRQYKRTGDIRDLEEAIQTIRKAQRNDDAIGLGKEVLDLLPVVQTRTLTRTDQQFVISTFAGVAADLCAFFLSVDRLNDALQSLEQGRAVIISQLLDDRSDISLLCRDNPHLANQYQSLVNELNSPARQATPSIVGSVLVERQQKATAELATCLKKIRALPSHERFLLGQTISEMQESAVDGSIVVVNVTNFRSDAILISAHTITSITLSEMLVCDVKAWLSKNWTSNKKSEQRGKNDKFLEYLSWLWNVCVKHIVAKISASQTHSSEGLPRVWWIGSGLASSMPFHAAGVHTRGSKENAYCRMISSYTPSIKALAYIQNQAKRAQKTLEAQDLSATQKQLSQTLPWAWWIGSGILNSMPFHSVGRFLGGLAKNSYGRILSFFPPLVKALAYAQNLMKPIQGALVAQDTNTMLIAAMPTSPKGPNDKKTPKKLPGAEKEMRAILNLAGSHLRAIAYTHPSTDQVLEVLKTCRIAHFACHGTSDYSDPSRSGLILQKSTGPGETLEQDRLTVRRVSDLRLKSAQIAYLSACSTAENKAERLSDEVIHIVSGFQVAGFPHVIGCLWPAGDSECVEVAKRFYSLVLQQNQSVINNEVSSALHEAVMAVRVEDLDMPLNWAQFVHYGA
ncbi:hypothetical protein FOWG_09905 [Fusarium oxysporum f. sp. lycopersici MN25]|nr:hypothetical protein FOWG_09905 [Fusarium oxysporum f. sp. lycopersici MN25]